MTTPRLRADLLTVYLAYVFRYVYPLVMLPFFGRTLGADGYGVVLAGMSLANTLWMLVAWGFPAAGGRDVVRADGPVARAAILRAQLSGRLLLCLPVAACGAAAVFVSPVFEGREAGGLAMVVFGCAAGFNLGWFLTATRRARTSVSIEVFGFAFSLALLVGCVRGPGDVPLVFGLMLLSCLVQLGLAHVAVWRDLAGVRPDLAAGARAVREATPLFVYSGTSALLIVSSTYVLSLFAPAGEVAAFGVAERLISAGLSVMGPASQILFPRITRLVADDPGRANRDVRRLLLVFAGGALVAAGATMALAPLVVDLLVGHAFADAVPILRLLALVLPVNAASQVIGQYFLIPRQHDGLLARAALLSAGVNLACALPLAGHWGAMGMASARLLGELLLLAVVLGSVWRGGLLGELLGPRVMRRARA